MKPFLGFAFANFSLRGLLRFLLRLAVWTGAFVVLVLALAIVGLNVFEKELTQKALISVFRAPLTLEKAEVDWLANFPETHIEVKDLKVASTNPRFPGNALTVKTGKVDINLFKLLTNRTHKFVRRIALDSCYFDQQVDSQFVKNYAYFQPPKNRRRPPPKEIIIEELLATNFRLRDRFELRARDYQLRFDTARLGLAIYPDRIETKGVFKGKSEKLRIGKMTFMENAPLASRFNLRINKSDKWIYLNNTVLSLAGTDMHLSGDLRGGVSSVYNLKIDAPRGNIHTLLSLFPMKAGSMLNRFNISGTMELKGSIVGADNDVENPHVELNFACNDGQIDNKRNGSRLRNLALKGSYNNGDSNSVNTTNLTIEKVQGKLGQSSFDAALKLTDFDDLFIDGRLSTAMHFQDLVRFLDLSNVSKAASGSVDMNLRARGLLANFTKRETIKKTYFYGDVRLHNIGYPIPKAGLDLSELNGAVNFSGDDIDFHGFSLRLNDQRISLDGALQGFVPYLAGESERLNGSLVLNADFFDLNRFFNIIFRSKEERLARKEIRQKKKKKNAKPKRAFDFDFDLPGNTDVTLTLKADNMKIGRAVFQEAATEVKLLDRLLTVRHFILKQDRHRSAIDITVDARSRTINKIDVGVNFQIDPLQTLLSDLGVKSKKPTPKKQSVGLSFGGLAHFTGTIEKNVPDDERPKARFRLLFHQGELRTNDGKIQVSKFRFAVHLDENALFQPKEIRLTLDSLSGRVNQYPFRARLTVNNLREQKTHLYLQAGLSLSEMLSYVSLDYADQPRGEIEFETNLHGRLSQFFNSDSVIYLPTEGNLSLRGLGFRLKKNDMDFSEIYSEIYFDREGVQLHELCGQMEKTNFRIQGSLREILPYIFLPDKPLIANVRFEADSVDVTALLRQNNVQTQPKTRTKGEKRKKKERVTEMQFRLPQYGDLTANIFVQNAQWNDLNIDSIGLKTTLKDGVARLERLSFNVFEGNVLAEGVVDASAKDTINMSAQLKLNAVRIEQLLRAANNFNQNFITDSTLQGRLFANLTVRDRLPANLKTDFSRLYAELNFDVLDAQLSDFKPLQKLHPLVNKKYLSDVGFALVGRDVYFENKTLYIPQLELRSGLINALIYGFFTADQQLEFHLTASLPPRRERNLPPDLNADITRRYNRSVLAFKIDGTTKAYKVHFDRATAISHLLSGLSLKKAKKISKETLEQLLRKREARKRKKTQ